jgi:pimeloyl-ACP methyl ester carboxylesterase
MLDRRRLLIALLAVAFPYRSPTVVVENGSSGFSIEWAVVQPAVAALTRICSYDRAGYAWSDRGPAENTVEETMDDLHHLLAVALVPGPYVLWATRRW